MKTTKLCLLLAVVLSAPAHAAFRCVDEKGRTHVGDTPPAACAEVVMYEVTRTGSVIRKIEPTLTEEQVRAKAEAAEQAKIAARAAAEQKRKDTALLSTYANVNEFDIARDRNIEPLQQRIKQSEQRIKDIDKRMKTLKEEMEFYTAGKKRGSKDDAAAPMAAELKRLDDEKAQITRNIEGYHREIGEIRTKFEVDKERWIAIKSGRESKK